MADADEHDHESEGAEQPDEDQSDEAEESSDESVAGVETTVTGLVSPALASRLTALTEGLLAKAPLDDVRAMGDRVVARANEVVASSFPKSEQWGGVAALASNAKYHNALSRAAGLSLMQPAARSAMAELLGRSAADRAAFSLTSGLKISDSLTARITAAAAASATPASWHGLTAASSLAELGLTARSSTVEGLTKSLRTEGPFTAGARLALARSLASQQLIATSGIADAIDKNSMAASWRQSLLAEATARSLAETVSLPDGGLRVLRDLVGVNATTARVVGQYADLNKTLMLGPAVSVGPTRELRSFLTSFPEAPDLDDLAFAGQASRGIAGIAAADILRRGGSIGADAADLLEAEVVDPWVSGPQRAREGLLARLGHLDPHIPEFLQAGWDQVERNGPAAVSMTANAIVEALTRTLRALAPNEDVMEAYEAGRLPKESVYKKDGKFAPTHAGRVAFACLGHPARDRKLVRAQALGLIEAIPVLRAEVEAAKHASQGNIELLRTYLVAAESLLLQLLHEHDN